LVFETQCVFFALIYRIDFFARDLHTRTAVGCRALTLALARLCCLL